jgi:2-hydroxy-3-oxopropionate reductase
MTPTVGFIGIGIMGEHMARHLLDAGYPLVAYDVSSDALRGIVARGARGARSCEEVAYASDLVISMVPDSPDVEEVALGRSGIVRAARSGLIYVDMSTIAPSVAIRVAEELGRMGVSCLDAPVSGGEVGAKSATLSIMVGGSEDLFCKVLPVFEVLGKTITHCGGNGAGQTVKACNQIQVALNLVGMAEALVLGAKAGVEPTTILKVLSGGYAQTRVMDVRGPKVVKGDFEPGFKARFHLKDLNIIMETAKSLDIALPGTSVAQQLFQVLASSGRGDLDHSAVIKVIEDFAEM